jgi:hypothetical protein
MTEPYASPGYSDLSIDLLIHMVQLVELPDEVAFRSVYVPCMALLPLPRLPLRSHLAAHHGSCPWRRSIFMKANKVVSSHHGWLVAQAIFKLFTFSNFYWPMGGGGDELGCCTGLRLLMAFLAEYTRLLRSIFLALYILPGMDCF